MAIFKKPAIKIQDRKKRDIPQGLFQKCPGCDEVIHEIELIENQRVCPHCDSPSIWIEAQPEVSADAVGAPHVGDARVIPRRRNPATGALSRGT